MTAVGQETAFGRSSFEIGVARMRASSRLADGLVDVMDDAMRNVTVKLTHARLCNWQAALFPTGRFGIARIKLGTYRTRSEPMQIVSGRPGGFEGGMSAGKCGSIAGASKTTATRDLADLAGKGVLEITGQGRATRYVLAGIAGGTKGT